MGREPEVDRKGERMVKDSETTEGINTISDLAGWRAPRVAAGGLDKSIRVWRLAGETSGTLEKTFDRP